MRHLLWLTALLLAGCQDCNLRACVGSLRLRFVDADGAPLSEFSGRVSWEESDGAGGITNVGYTFACGAEDESAEGPVKCSNGSILVVHAPDVLDVLVETPDGRVGGDEVVSEPKQTADEMTCGACEGSEASVVVASTITPL